VSHALYITYFCASLTAAAAAANKYYCCIDQFPSHCRLVSVAVSFLQQTSCQSQTHIVDSSSVMPRPSGDADACVCVCANERRGFCFCNTTTSLFHHCLVIVAHFTVYLICLWRCVSWLSSASVQLCCCVGHKVKYFITYVSSSVRIMRQGNWICCQFQFRMNFRNSCTVYLFRFWLITLDKWS